MKAALFNAIYTPLSVHFGRHIIALMPRELALKAVDDLEQNPENGLAIALEHCIQYRFFAKLSNQEQLLATFDCTQQQYNKEEVPYSVITAAKIYLASDVTANKSQ